MKSRRAGGVGSVSLVLIFSTLCLSIFSVLSLSDAVGQKSTSALLAESVTDYYAADTNAERVLAALSECLRTGTDVPDTLCGAAVTVSEESDGTHYAYACDIDEKQVLTVEAVYADNVLTITRWAKGARGEWVGDDGIPVLQ